MKAWDGKEYTNSESVLYTSRSPFIKVVVAEVSHINLCLEASAHSVPPVN